MARHKGGRKPPAAKKPPLTHFLCLPLVTPSSKPQLEASLAAFRDAVTSPGSSTEENAEDASGDAEEKVLPSVHPKAIRPVGALHCTLGVMSLKQDELVKAKELLEGLDVPSLLRGDSGTSSQPKASSSSDNADGKPASLQRPTTPPQKERSTEPLKVDLKGLESMHAPEKTSILYIAPSDPSQRLYNFCLALQKTFKDRDLLVEDNRALKVHATIVNTIYAKGKKRPAKGKAGMSGESSSQPGATSNAAGTIAGDVKDDCPQGHGPNANSPLKIDATEILEGYRDFTWAENVVLDRVAICEMGAKKILNDQGNVKAEEYTEVASMALPV